MATGNKLVGQLIRQLRSERRLTGAELGRRAKMSQSKISKLETGYYARLQVREVERLLDILQAPSVIRQKIYEEIKTARPDALLYQPYNVAYSADLYETEAKAKRTRCFVIQNVPALLQTTEFRLAVLRRLGLDEKDIGSFMRDIMKRQELLWDQERSFHFIMHHAMLYTLPQPEARLRAPQLDRIERMMDLPNVKIGIIPLEAGLVWAETGAFVLHDDRLLTMASAGGEIISTDDGQIRLYERVFLELDQLALYGEAAKDLIRGAV